jgi:hypothetical protein
MIGDREHPPTDDPDIQLERAKAIWAFRTTELVTALWTFIAERRGLTTDGDAILDDLEQLAAGDEHPRPPRKVTAAHVRPAVPARICTVPAGACACMEGGDCQIPVWERELITQTGMEPGA